MKEGQTNTILLLFVYNMNQYCLLIEFIAIEENAVS